MVFLIKSCKNATFGRLKNSYIKKCIMFKSEYIQFQSIFLHFPSQFGICGSNEEMLSEFQMKKWKMSAGKKIERVKNVSLTLRRFLMKETGNRGMINLGFYWLLCCVSKCNQFCYWLPCHSSICNSLKWSPLASFILRQLLISYWELRKASRGKTNSLTGYWLAIGETLD